MARLALLLAACVLVAAAFAPAHAAANGARQHAMLARPEFVRASGTRLWLGTAEYRVRGANYWQAMHLGMAAGPSANRTRVLADLARLRSLGITTVRILAASEGSAPHPTPLQRLAPPLMPLPGQYDLAVLEGLDWVLATLPSFGMTAVVSLANYWTWSGGAAQLVAWADGPAAEIPYPAQWDPVRREMAEGAAYEEFLAYANRLFDPDDPANPAAQRVYREHVRALVTRVNSVNGVRYADDPAVLAWELMNEPQASRHVARWIAESAALVRSLDANHLVTPGAECKNGAAWFERMHRAAGVSLATCHFWPANWGLYNASDPTVRSLRGAIGHMHAFVEATAAWARRLGLPVVLAEYGMGRDARMRRRPR
ncbi:hypothetical protein GGI15_001450 [Coemansia interrupta]|uniref:mannan endo-1,4-beta-mannosidase n=1 Tax=Coemansia interrupta TaxID=1126814 RepID=A0A9W8LMI9_9FUNG|nr:hypothetical protein GGI15_001450 [Coemansia interrupta]